MLLAGVCSFPRLTVSGTILVGLGAGMGSVGCSVTLDPTVRVEEDRQDLDPVLASCTFFRSETSEYQLCEDPLAWRAAEHDCQLRGAALASIEGVTENGLIQNAAQSVGTNVWLGGSRDDDFVWSWATGEVFWSGGVNGQPGTGSYVKWAPNEPNDASTTSTEPERCLALTLVESDWNDRACSLRLPYVCERPLTATAPGDGDDDDEPDGSAGDAGIGIEDAGGNPQDSGGDPGEPATLELVSSSPAAGETGVATDTDIELVFDRDIGLLTGSFALLRMPDGSVFESVDVTSSAVTLDGSVLTIDLDGVLAENTVYAITLDAAAVEGVDGSLFEGLANEEDAVSFTTGATTLPGGVSDGLELWLDATFSGSIKATGGSVSVWGDRSGNNSSVRQLEPTGQPLLVEGAINSRAVVRFDGSSDVLEGPILDALQEYDVFLVWQSPLEPPAGAQTHLLRNGSFFEINHGHNEIPFRHAGASLFDSIWMPAQFEQPVIDRLYVWNLSLDSAAGTLTAFTNGIATATTSDLAGTPVASSEPLTLGSRWGLARHFTGDIGEVILYGRALAQIERTAVQSYLGDKWGL